MEVFSFILGLVIGFYLGMFVLALFKINGR